MLFDQKNSTRSFEKLQKRYHQFEDLMSELLESRSKQSPLSFKPSISSSFSAQRLTTLPEPSEIVIHGTLDERTELAFALLSQFYDIGLWLEPSHSNDFVLHSYFEAGRLTDFETLQAQKSEELKKWRIHLPQQTPGQVISSQSSTLFQRLPLTSQKTLRGPRALLFRASSRRRFLLISQLPDLWLREHSRLTQNLLTIWLHNDH